MNLATVTVTHLPDATVISASGEIDVTTAPDLREVVRQNVTEHPGVLVIDLSQARFFSSAGIAALVLAQRGTADATALRVVAQHRAVLRPLELAGLVEDLAIYPTVESALAG
jgi:anti-sigma B factor antagonist